MCPASNCNGRTWFYFVRNVWRPLCRFTHSNNVGFQGQSTLSLCGISSMAFSLQLIRRLDAINCDKNRRHASGLGHVEMPVGVGAHLFVVRCSWLIAFRIAREHFTFTTLEFQIMSAPNRLYR